jgi:hypothetical protein
MNQRRKGDGKDKKTIRCIHKSQSRRAGGHGNPVNSGVPLG